MRLFTSLGNLDATISYVEGTDPRPDVYVSDKLDAQRSYHKEKSPAIDLQYNFGSFFGKLAYAYHLTEDDNGDDPFIKNSWDHLAFGIETSFGASTLNLYAGQITVKNWQESNTTATLANQLMDQSTEHRTFVSGHLTSSFLTGDAMQLTLFFAQYWDKEGAVMQSFVKPTLSYKITDGFQVLAGASYAEASESIFQTAQLEARYSF